MRRYSDHTILAFHDQVEDDSYVDASVLASSRSAFINFARPGWSNEDINSKVNLVDDGLSLELVLCPEVGQAGQTKYIGFLDCMLGSDFMSRLAIRLHRVNTRSGMFQRHGQRPEFCLADARKQGECTMIRNPGVTGMQITQTLRLRR